MIYNHSFLQLGLESRTLLLDLFQGCPIMVNLNAPVSLMISPDQIPVNYEEEYDARLMPLQFVFDVESGRNLLVLPLYSAKLMARYQQLSEQCRPAFSNFYFPHMVLNASLPPMRRTYKSILNSLSDAFVAYRHEIVLGHETVVAEDFIQDPNNALYTQMAAQAGIDLG